jgi:transposase
MSTKPKRYSSAFKAKVAVEAIRSVKTTAELASEHQMHRTLVGQRKRRALENQPVCSKVGRTRYEADG